MPRASIIIVEYRTAAYLGSCLEALGRLEVPAGDLQVIVVDNGSPTSTAHLHARFPGVRFLFTGRNLGFAGGCMAALPYCTANVLILLNPDATVMPGWLDGMLRPFEDPRVGVVGCKVYSPGTRILQHAGGLVRANGLTDHRGRGELDVGQYDRVEDVTYVTGASMAVRRQVIARVGFLSTAYHPAYYEETELCLRARRAGYRVVFTPRAAVSHHEAVASGGTRARAYLRRYHGSRVRFVLRNYRLGDLFSRFLPAEVAFHLSAGRAPGERQICARAYLAALLPAGGPSGSARVGVSCPPAPAGAGGPADPRRGPSSRARSDP